MNILETNEKGQMPQERNRRYREKCQDFPGGPGVKNPSSNAGDVGLIPGWGTKIPHAVGQLF